MGVGATLPHVACGAIPVRWGGQPIRVTEVGVVALRLPAGLGAPGLVLLSRRLRRHHPLLRAQLQVGVLLCGAGTPQRGHRRARGARHGCPGFGGGFPLCTLHAGRCLGRTAGGWAGGRTPRAGHRSEHRSVGCGVARNQLCVGGAGPRRHLHPPTLQSPSSSLSGSDGATGRHGAHRNAVG